jgi:hypothetical protein
MMFWKFGQRKSFVKELSSSTAVSFENYGISRMFWKFRHVKEVVPTQKARDALHEILSLAGTNKARRRTLNEWAFTQRL